MTTTRRLAAILAADVAGYSRLMGADEVGTLEALKAHRREVVDPAIAANRGRIVKTTGDGLLLEFPSVVNTLCCAVELQTAIADRSAEKPEDRRIAFRLGIKHHRRGRRHFLRRRQRRCAPARDRGTWRDPHIEPRA